MAENENRETCSTRKKFKTCTTFQELHKCKRSIEEEVKKLDSVKFCFVKIAKCNGDVASSFPQAWCHSSRNIHDPTLPYHLRSKVATFNEMFDTGLLLRALNEPQKDINVGLTNALKRLELFFENSEDTNDILVKRLSYGISKGELAGLFGTHLLKPLAVDQQMTISDSDNSEMTVCSCKSSTCNGTLKYGDTSLGHPNVWHGSVDIMIGSVAVDIIDYMEVNEEANSVTEVNLNNFEEHRSQLIAETIVFGFVQKQGHVPLIALSKEQMKLYLYNPDEDLLYESMECSIFGEQDNTLSLTVVLMLWFALNYQYFSKPEDPSHLEDAYMSGFKTLMRRTEGVSNIYENEMRFGGCKYGKTTLSSFVWPGV